MILRWRRGVFRLPHGNVVPRGNDKSTGNINTHLLEVRSRVPRLTDGKMTGKYRYSIRRFLENGTRISRADVAHFILDNSTHEDLLRTTVEVAY